MPGLDNNLTLDILSKAEKGGYGILAQVCYDANSAVGLVRAAERAKSPAMLLLFPVTLLKLRGPFLQYCLTIAHNASVPISVHLDHACDDEVLELALSLAEQGIAFDSIMVDASHADTDEENIAIAKPYIDRAYKAGVAVEVELGRMEGGEAGLRSIDGGQLTKPDKAEDFVKETGAVILAPCIGNLHGSYKFIGGPKFRQDILLDIKNRKFSGSRLGRPLLCLHGTDELPDELFTECIQNGVSKVNVNSWCRDTYVQTFAKALLDGVPFPDATELGVEAFAKEAERFMVLFGSAGKAQE